MLGYKFRRKRISKKRSFEFSPKDLKIPYYRVTITEIIRRGIVNERKDKDSNIFTKVKIFC